MNIYSLIQKNHHAGQKMFAVLVDPDKSDPGQTAQLAKLAGRNSVDFIFVGSSLLTKDNFESCVSAIKNNCNIPVVLFPGSALQISTQADALLFLSLISGRNADLLIGKHVITAPLIKHSGLESIPTGYILVDPGHPTAVSYMSNTQPIPYDKPDIAQATAIAGEMLGLKLLFMDCGSGARLPVSSSMIRAVKSQTNIPIVVGGGIRTPERALETCRAGASIVVVGNSIEQDSGIISELSQAIHSVQEEKL